MVVSAIEAGRAIGAAADAAGGVLDHAIGVGAIAMVGSGIESSGTRGFTEAVIKVGRIGQDEILVGRADQAGAGGALDAHARIVMADGDVGGEVVDAGIDEDGVAEFQVIGFQDGANGGLGGGGSQAVVGVIGGGGGV